ncbi:MAG: RnfABCDGE type electron transport complex subunit D, partial [Bdellovibrionota bacterium]
METTATVGVETPKSGALRAFRRKFEALDPRIPVAAILFSYLVLGLTVLGFTRSPWQVVITTISCCALEMALTRAFKGKWVFPFSAMITSFSLSFLLNYGHDYFLLFIPLFFAIGSKYVFTFNGKHALNPAMVGVSLSLLFAEELVTAAPAYQWTGIASMSIFILMLGLIFVIPKVNRHVLVLTFLITFTIQTFLRAMIMRHHLPFETLFLGTLTSPSFLIFTFFMITDPATSPNDRKQQIIVGISLATVDLLLHLRQSYYTFFYAALIVGSTRLLWNHTKGMRRDGIAEYFKARFFTSGYYLRPVTLGILALVSIVFYRQVLHPSLPLQSAAFRMEAIPASVSGLDASEQGDVYAKLDPRVQHVAKWVLSVGDAVATGDFDGDGYQDLFLTNVLKTPSERAMLYRYAG